MKTRTLFTGMGALAVMLLALPVFSQQDRGFLAGKKFDLNGPTPRLSNGKPDLTGVWDRPAIQDITRPMNAEGMTFTPEPALPFTEWGKKQWESHDPKNDYVGACLPYGFPRAIVARHPMQLLQHSDFMAFLFEQNSWFTVVPIDGRPHPKDAMDTPSWFGNSVGRWEGDTLVISTIALNGLTKLDTVGHPLSTQGRLTQRFTRTSFGRMDYEMIVDDPKTYTRPLKLKHTWVLRPEWEIMEYSCTENNLDLIRSGVINWKRPADVD
jgi:hypothetical protein